MMSELVTYINELVNDQVQMRSCIPLTPELQDFFEQLMGKIYDQESVGSAYQADDVDDGEKSIQKFLMARKKSKRSAVS